MRTSSDLYLSLGNMGLSLEDFHKKGNPLNEIEVDVLLKIFDMSKEELSSLYGGLGIGKDISCKMEALHYVLLWLYLSGRASIHGLNPCCKVEYSYDRLSGEWMKRCDTTSDIDRKLLMYRLREVTGCPKEFSWLLVYVAEKLINGSRQEKLQSLKRLLFNSRSYIFRHDYAGVLKYIDLDRMQNDKKPICTDMRTLYCIMDSIRIDACLRYKSEKNDFILAMTGAKAIRNKVVSYMEKNYPDYHMILPEMKFRVYSLPTLAYLKDLKLGRQIRPGVYIDELQSKRQSDREAEK